MRYYFVINEYCTNIWPHKYWTCTPDYIGTSIVHYVIQNSDVVIASDANGAYYIKNRYGPAEGVVDKDELVLIILSSLELGPG